MTTEDERAWKADKTAVLAMARAKLVELDVFLIKTRQRQRQARETPSREMRALIYKTNLNALQRHSPRVAK